MITRIEIDGFKSFQEFSLDLAPFQVIIGPNGCGKSNLFDAIHFLSLLADKPVNEALQSLRGEARDLFTILPDGTRAKQMRFAVEMRVPPTVTDAWGDTEELEDTHLRYELEIPYGDSAIMQSGITASEKLISISASDIDSRQAKEPHIGPRMISLYGDNRDMHLISFAPVTRSGKVHKPRDSTGHYYIPSTSLSKMDKVDLPYPLVVRQEMQSWRQFNPLPVYLRQSSTTLDTPFLTSDGKNLAAALARMEQESPASLNDVSRDLTNIMRSSFHVGLDKDEKNDRITVYVKNKAGHQFPARVLSDGTLRLLALATIRNDPAFRGTLCFEDPETGAHPGGLRKIADILRDTTVPFDLEDANEPQRQVLVTTHSTDFISHLNLPDELLYAEMPLRIEPGVGSSQVTRISPVGVEGETDKANSSYTLSRVIEYLTNADIETKREELCEAWRK